MTTSCTRTPPPNPVHQAAAAYVAAGLSVIPIALDGTKRPASDVLPRVPDPDHPDRLKATWKPFMERIADAAELARWFGGRRPAGVAVVFGAVSGGAELIDLDDKETAAAFLAEVADEAPDLLARLSLEDTPRGVHVVYRCEINEGNRKLAQRPDGFGEKGELKVKTLIETRGEGGYAVVAGGPLEVHELRLPYAHRGGPPLTDLGTITAGERDLLFRVAMSFDRADERHRPNFRPPPAGDLTPADDYDLRGPAFDELLPDARFRNPGRDDGVVRRPGKERGVSGTVGHCRGSRGEPLLKVFSTNWHPFEGGKCYGRFQALRLTRFRGDGAGAMRWLRGQGYGSPRAGRNGHHEPAAEPGPNPDPEPEPETASPATSAGEEWDDPVPLDDPADTPPPFPLGALPPALADLCRDIGDTIGCPPDYAAAFALAAAAGTCGAAVALNVKPDWVEHASLFVCAVAPPNAGKTPSFKLVTRPVVEEQSRRVAARDKQPPAYVGDVTVEKLAEILKDSPRGTLLLRDELAGWVKGMDQYKAKGGSDRQFWLSAWSSDAVSVHRKNPDSPHVFIPHPCVSVAGGIQPEVLASLRGNDDGFFDRLLFTFPPPLPAKGEDWRSCDPRLVRAWDAALGVLRGVEMVETHDRLRRPHFVRLSSGARDEWEAYTLGLARRMNDPEFPRHLAGVAGKLKGYAARLALVSMLLRAAYVPGGEVEDLTAGDMRNGAAVAAYFLGHAERVYRAMGRDATAADAAKVLRWVKAHGEKTFSRRDAHRGLRKSFPCPEMLADPLRRLVQHGYLRPSGGGPPTSDGRRPTAVYTVHPSLLEPGDTGDTGDRPGVK